MSTAQAPAPSTRTVHSLQNAAILMALFAMVGLGAWLRLHAIDAKSLWTDEGVSAALARLGWYDFARILWRREANMTLYYLLLRAWTQMGHSVAMNRGLSVLPSLATIPVIYAVGRRLFNSRVGLMAALLLTVNAYSIRYAQEARSYSLVAFLVTLATYFFVRAVESGRKRDWTWYVATSTLAVYAHFFAVLVLVAHWVSLKAVQAGAAGQEPGATISRSAGSGFRRAAALIGLWTLPIWGFIATTGAGPVKWIQRPTGRDLYSFVEHFAGNAGASLFWLYVACAALTVIIAARHNISTLRSAQDSAGGAHQGWRYALPVMWFAVPVAVTLAFSLARPVFLARYMIICLPALVLMVAIGLAAFRQRWLALPVLAAICWFAVGGVRAFYRQDFDIGREDFRSAARHIVAQARPGDLVLFQKGLGRFPYSYYADRLQGVKPSIAFPGSDKPTWRSFMGKVTPELRDQLARSHQRVWLVLSENLEPSGEDPQTRQLRDALGSTHRLTDTQQFSYVRVDLYEP